MIRKALLISFLLVFCGSMIAGTGALAAEPATITITLSDAMSREGLDAVIAVAKEKTGITVDLDVIPSAGAEDILKTRLASGDMGDLFLNNVGAQMITLNPKLNMADLSDEPFAARLDLGFKTAGSADGALYSAPLASSMGGGLLYNKKVYQELGLEVPLTWADFMANCDVIKAAGKTAILGTFKDDWTSQIFLLADYYNVAAAAPDFAADFTVNKAKYATTPAALRSWEKLYESNAYMNADYMATTLDIAVDRLVSGEGVHWPMLTFIVQTIEANYGDEVNNIGFFPVPSDDASINGITVWPSNSLHIYSQSPNIEAAKRFLDFYLSDEGISLYNQVAKPTGPNHILGVELGDDMYECTRDMLPYFEAGHTIPAMEFSTPVKGPACPQLCIAVGSNMNTAAEGAALYDQDCEKQAIQLGLEGW